MAYIYVTSFLISASLSLWYRRKIIKDSRSPRLVCLNQNLAKCGLYWSTDTDEFRPLTETSVADDLAASLKSFRRFALFACFMSAFGLLLLCVFILSMRIFARPRIERRVFASPLATTALSKDQVASLVAEFVGEFNLDSPLKPSEV